MEKTAGQKSTKTGVVSGKNMKKTVSVIVERQVRHPLYKKIVRENYAKIATREKNSCCGPINSCCEPTNLAEEISKTLVVEVKKPVKLDK